MRARREFLRSAYSFLFTAACSPGTLFGPEACPAAIEAPPVPSSRPELRDVYVVNDYSGVQLGTKGRPYSVRTAAEYDALMSFLSADDYLAHHWEGRFATKGSYRWGPAPENWRAGRYWTIDGAAEVSIDPNAIPDSQIAAQPLYVIATRAGRPQVRGITLNASHSALADRWRSRGLSLRTGGPLLYGDGLIDGVTVRNCGGLRAPGQPKEISSEAFVAEIVGAGSITNCLFTDHDVASSDDQVTVWRVMASESGETISDTPCLLERNTTHVPGSRLVQAHTLYGVPGVVRFNKSVGADLLYYGDYFATRDVTIEENDAEQCRHGVQLTLSPTPLPIAANFSHERYDIGVNRFDSSRANVSLINPGPSTSTRYMRQINVHPSLSLEVIGDVDYTREISCRRAA